MVNYTCEICTDYIDPSKTEEILKNVTRIVSQAYMNRAVESEEMMERGGANAGAEAAV